MTAAWCFFTDAIGSVMRSPRRPQGPGTIPPSAARGPSGRGIQNGHP
ncbi:hypothetical protein B005_0226 [Nocardiopsis alba ATCC BAA-2165]|uniref:Uncharacterized protein n=1 Tax=Nocardiopsis alba (strain ATCC BAA-2165 / BE74) TaxID=1205910 RepID=J7LB19_NOCAA|nr:hypothetical protein B005_0226 [Nocardiopsis alba ATCC BAA-2165]